MITMETTPVSLADISNLVSGMRSAMAWIWSLFTRIVDTIASNDLLLYPVLLFIVTGAIALVIKIVRAFGMKSRRS